MSINLGVCKIDAVIKIGSKGQMVLPEDLREKANFRPNGKIAVVVCEKQGEVCCIMRIKAEKLEGALSETLSPLLQGVIQEEK